MYQNLLTEVDHGVASAVISPYVIAAIGERHARRYMLTAERFAAAEAYRIGLLHEIVPDEAALDEAIGEIVDALLKNSPNALSDSARRASDENGLSTAAMVNC